MKNVFRTTTARIVLLALLVLANIGVAAAAAPRIDCRKCVMQNGWPACPVRQDGKWQICTPSGAAHCLVIAMGCSGDGGEQEQSVDADEEDINNQ